jgi:anti-anti-sigma factor
MAGSPYPCSGEFQMHIEHKGEAAVVKLAGSIHMNVCEQLRMELIRLVEKPTRPLILDLSQLTFICSLGLGALVAAHLHCRHNQGAVRVVSPNPSIRALLEITKLVKLFPPYDSVERAMGEA